MPKFLTPINLNQLELQKAVIENYAGNPNGAVSGVDGQILWDSTNDKLYLCTGGTTWVVSSGEIVDTNTTYSISAETATGGANLRLTAAAPSLTDDVKLANGTSISITRTDDSTITIAHADTSTITGLQGGNGVSSVTVDGEGHVTAVGTTTYVTSVGATAPVASSGGATPTISMAAATASVDGYMTSAYASKLDGIAAGAEVNQNAFNTIVVSGQSDVVADSKTDTLTLVAGTNVAITTNATTDTITISSTDTNTTSLPVKDSAGTTQFTSTDSTGIRFLGSGAASVSFTPATQLVTITATDTNTATHADGIMDGSNTGTQVSYEPFASAAAGKLSWTAAPTAGTTDLSYSGYFRANRLYGGEVYDNGTRVLTAHPSIAAASSVNNSGRTYIQDITLDANGHITGLVSATETVVDTNTTYSISSETVANGANLRLTGSDASTDNVSFIQGTGITVTRTDVNTITIASTLTDTNWYPTTFAWTDGTTAGPTGSLTGIGMSAVSYAAIPSASASASGVVTTAAQTFAGDKTFNNNVVVTGNLTVNGTTTIVNSTVQTFDDPVITLGGDTVAVETAMSRGVEFKHNGTTLTMTNFIGNGTTTVTGTVASTVGFAAGDIITISGATGTEQTKLNGTWKIATVPNGTTFTFIVSTSVSAGTLTTTLGTTVKAKNGFIGYNQSTDLFVIIPQSNNTGEVFTGIPGNFSLSSAVFSGSTSGTITLIPTAVAGTTTLTMPATTGTLALTSQLPTVNNGTLTLQTGIAAATNNTVVVSTGTGFSANTASNSTYELRVGPALTALAAQMTGAGTGFLRKNGADTFSLDTTTYLSGTVTPANGGTGLSTVTNVGELYAGNTTSAMTRIAPVAAGSVLVSNGTAAAPVYSANPVVTSITAANYYGSSSASGNAKYSSTSNATKGTTEIGDSNAGTATVQGANVNIKVGAAASGGVLTVAATTGAVTVDTAIYAKKYSQTLSTSATSYVLTHNLGTQDIQVSIYEVASPYAQVYADVEHTSTNTVTIKFAVAPAINTYRVVVIG